jgi:DNA-binding IclR family transcriptional regulator
MGNALATKSVAKALDILEVICKSDGPLDLHEISRFLDLPSPTAYRLLQTLLEYGFVRQEKTTRKYSSGLKIFELSQSIIARMQFADVAREPLRKLASTTQETVHLAVLDHYEVIYLRKYESAPPTTLYSRIGRRAPAYCTGVGKVLLAYLPESDLSAFLQTVKLERLTENTITDKVALEAELVKIRQQGYAIDNMEHEDGVYCIACPIRGHTGEVIAATSVTAPTFRRALQDMISYLPLVQEEVLAISQELGYVEPERTVYSGKMA